MTITIREEFFDGSVRNHSLKDAIKMFGKSELYEYLQGYCTTSIFFAERDGENIYPITMADLG